MKICYTCKKEKPLSEFYKGKSYKNGYDYECKECSRNRRRNNHNNPKGNRHSKRLESDKQLWCPKCKTYKDKDEFYTNGNRTLLGYSTYCKKCDNSRRKNEKDLKKKRALYNKKIQNEEWKLSERKRKLEVWRKYKDTPKWIATKKKENHKRRANYNNSICDLTTNDVDLLLTFQEGKCAKCDKEFSKELRYELDHINPLSNGGGLTLKNVQLLCKSCNCIKGTKMIKYRDSINFISKEGA